VYYYLFAEKSLVYLTTKDDRCLGEFVIQFNREFLSNSTKKPIKNRSASSLTPKNSLPKRQAAVLDSTRRSDLVSDENAINHILGFKTPKEAIDGDFVDHKCPFTGNVSIRGRIFK
jgi:hypothetical protein